MADGFAPRGLLADGVYLDLPLRDYLADPAIGGHGALDLAASPCDWRWTRADNPLHREPQPSVARRHGVMVHTAVLDGLDAYERAYVVAPDKRQHPQALDTVADLRGWLRAYNDTVAPEARAKLTGARDELIARVRESGRGAVIWDDLEAELTRDRIAVSADDDRYVRLVEGFARNAYGALLEGGLSEVSVFFTESGVRQKARFDRITPARIVDVKKFGAAPRLGDSLRTHLVTEAAKHGYPVQALLHARAADWIAANSESLQIAAAGEGASDRIALMLEIARAWSRAAPLYTWLFLRCPGPPMGKPVAFRRTSAMWSRAKAIVEEAFDNYRAFHAMHGEAIWMDAQAEEDADDMDWPNYAFRTPLDGGIEL